MLFEHTIGGIVTQGSRGNLERLIALWFMGKLKVMGNRSQTQAHSVLLLIT